MSKITFEFSTEWYSFPQGKIFKGKSKVAFPWFILSTHIPHTAHHTTPTSDRALFEIYQTQQIPKSKKWFLSCGFVRKSCVYGHGSISIFMFEKHFYVKNEIFRCSGFAVKGVEAIVSQTLPLHYIGSIILLLITKILAKK